VLRNNLFATISETPSGCGMVAVLYAPVIAILVKVFVA
jgi:hypothetical protein